MNNISSTQLQKMLFNPASILLKSSFFFFFSLFISCHLQAATVTWLGATSSDWNTASNWDTNTVPIAGDYVMINNDLIDSGGFMPNVNTVVPTLLGIEFETTTSLTIAANGSITIDGTGCEWCFGVYLRRNSTLIIEENGSLEVYNTTRDGIYNYKASIINDGDIHVYDTAHRGINNYNNGSNNVGIMYFTNNGNILIQNTGTDGLYSEIRKDTLILENNGTIDLQDTGGEGWYNYAYQDSSYIDIDNHGMVQVSTTGEDQVGIYNQSRQTTVGEPVRLDFDNYGTIEVDGSDSYGFYNYAYRGELNFTNHTNATIDIQNIDQWGWYNYNRFGDGYTPTTNFNNYGTINIRNTFYGGIQNFCNGHNFTFNNHHIIKTSQTGQAGLYNYTSSGYSQLDFVNDGTITIDTSGTAGSWYNSGLINRARLVDEGDTTSVVNFTNNGDIAIDSTSFCGIYNNIDGGDLTFVNNANATISINKAYYQSIYNYNFERSYNTNNDFNFDNYGTINITNSTQHGVYNNSTRGDLDFNLHTNSVLTLDDIDSDGIRNSVSEGGLLNFVNDINLVLNNIERQGFYNSTRSGATLNFTNNHTIDINTTNQNGFYNDNENGNIYFVNNNNIFIDNVALDGFTSDNELLDPVNYTAAFTFDNYGDIVINTCGDDGFRTYINNHAGSITNHANALIDIDNCSDNGWINNSQGTNGVLNFNYNANSTINIDQTNSSGFYNYSNTGALINFLLNEDLNISQTGTYGIYSEMNNGSTLDFDLNATLNISDTGNSGLYFNNNNSHLDIDNSNTAAVYINSTGYRGIDCDNDYTNDAYTCSFSFDNYGLIRIEETVDDGFRSHTNNLTGNVTNHPNATLDISHIGEQGLINRSYGKGQLDFMYSAGSLLKIDTTNSRGMYNYASDSAVVNVIINEALAIDSCGTDGLRNTTRTGGIVNFTLNADLDIEVVQNHGIANDNENGSLNFINHQNITINDVGGDGIQNENDIYNNDYSGTFTFENRGNITVKEAGDEGIYTHSNNMVSTFTNFADASIDISDTREHGWYTGAWGGGQLDFIHQSNADFKVDTSRYSCIYHSVSSGGIVNATFDDVIDLDSCGVEGIYNLIRTDGTINLTNNSTVDINTVNNSGMWSNNENGTFNFINNGNFNIDGVQQYNGIAAQSRTTDASLYSTANNYTNNGTIDIKNTGSHGIDSYCQGPNATFDIVNDGTIQIDGTVTHGILNNSHQEGIITFENKVNRNINIQNIGNRGLYNLTNDSSRVNFVNHGSIDIDNTGNVGVYNYTRDGWIDFTNNHLIDIFNADAEAGFYNYTQQNADQWTTELTFNNNGTINIADAEGHGLIFNTSNGTANINNTAAIDVENTLYRGFYIYNRQNTENRICQTNFTNTSTASMDFNNINEDGIYVYTYRDSTEFVNDGAITINKTGWRGMNLYSDNTNALLNFTNNGTVEIDTTGTEGWHNQCRRQGTADSPPTTFNFTNNGTIDIDSTQYEGFQTNGERGYIHLINSANAEIRIRRTAEFGWHSYLYKNEDTMTVNQLIENHGLIDIADTDWSGMQHYNYRADNHHFINQASGIIRIKDTSDKGLEIENFGNSTSYDPFTNFTNHGLIDIDNIPSRGIEVLCNRGNTANFANHGTIDIFKTEEYGIFNYAYNASTDYHPITNFDNWGTVNIDSTALAGIQNYCYQSKEVNFNQHGGDINITRSFDHGIVCYPLQYNRDNYSPRVHFNMDGGSINIDGTVESGIHNYAYRDTIEVNITAGTINITNTDEHGIYNYAYDDWASLNFHNGGTINTDQTGRNGIYNYNYNNSSNDTTSLDFTNTGTINTNNSSRSGINNFNRSGTNFTFNNSGDIHIQNTNSEGFRNLNLRHNDNYSVTFGFDNSGEINIQTTFQEGFRTSNYGGDFTLDNTGLMMIQNSNREGMENVNYRDNFNFNNNGIIHILNSKNEDLYNSALKIGPFNFTNGDCALIQVNGKIKNHRYSNFVNNGIIMTAYDGFNDNKGNFTNNGIIEGRPDEYFETFSFQGIDNQGTILDYNLLEPLTGTVGQDIPNAINDPDAIYTIVGWFTDETLTTSAGSYNSGTNTFTPNVGVGVHTLFVETTNSTLSCGNSIARPVEVTINPVMLTEEEENIVVTLTPQNENETSLKETAAAKPLEAPHFNGITNLQLYPNPFDKQTNIQFQVASDDFVRIEVYGMDGQQIAVLFEGYLSTGNVQQFGFNADGLRSGIYLLRMVTDKGESKNLRMVLNK